MGRAEALTITDGRKREKMEEKIYAKLNEIFRDIFDDDEIVVTPETNSDSIEDWDSLEHINLVVAIEKTFHMKFSMDEVTGMKDVGEMVEIILQRGSGID